MGEKKQIAQALNNLARGKDVALLGCGASAKAASRLLACFGINTLTYQQSKTNHAVEDSNAIENFDANAAKKHSLVVYSPAFRPDHEWLELGRKSGATTLCEPDLAALAFGGKIIAITGTDGKTTTTSFLTHALKMSGLDAFSAGNIGEPLSNFCAKIFEENIDDSKKIAVCELSSFQTAALKNLRPDALVWTNFAPDHLDWHIDMKEYFLSKFNLVKFLKKGDASKTEIFVCGDDVEKYAKEFSIKLPDFSAVLDFEKMRTKGELDFVEPFASFVQAQNFAVVKKLWQKLGFDTKELFQAAKTFELPQFRFGEKVEVGGVEFYNDSKATNAHSAIAALGELKNAENLIWIGGGKDKACSLDDLVGKILSSAKGAVLIGQTADALKQRLGGLPLGAFVCDSLEEAVRKAYQLCAGKKGACVLFSPAFSSFGMFSGYQERGKSFQNAVLCLKNLK